MFEGIKSWFKITVGAILLAFAGVSCVHDVGAPERSGDDVVLTIKFGKQGTKALHDPDEFPGTDIDTYVSSLRVLAFEIGGTQSCVSNVLYLTSSDQGSLRHQIERGEYHFVFVANEPPYAALQTELENIAVYSDMNTVAIPTTAFTSKDFIPMVSVVENVFVMSDNEVSVNSAASQTALGIYLTRLAARVDVQLEAAEDLTSEFTGVTFSNLPDRVPLMDTYTGSSPVSWSQIRTLSLADNPEYFGDHTPSGTNVWGKRVNRVIIPSSTFTPLDDASRAVTFTVNMATGYNPDCLLKIEDNPVNYNMEKNAKLDLIGEIRLPLELNIKASDWEWDYNEWSDNRLYLNLSQTQVDITDYNGARITFDSNAPSVRITGYYDSSGTFYSWSGDLFNELMWPTQWGKRFDYSYSSSTGVGSGYMDILINDTHASSGTAAGTYTLVLYAEKNGLTLQRHIVVNVSQYGTRSWFAPAGNYDSSGDLIVWGTSYVGAFYQNDQVGERVISGTWYGAWWEATVGNPDDPEELINGVNPRDWIIVSSAPSFDPNLGTDNPGDPEDYPVVPNAYKGEDGITAVGRHRVYFRIGLKSRNPGTAPRYGYITVRYIPSGNPVSSNPPTAEEMLNSQTFRIYVRQGDQPDYILGSASNPVARRIPIYNLTTQYMRDNTGYTDRTTNYVEPGVNGGVFTRYPTQGGALFQWGVNDPAYYRRAYYPRPAAGATDEFLQYGPIPNVVWTGADFTANPYWISSTGPNGEGYKSVLETCPPGYRRPNHGSETALAQQNTAADAATSEFLVSLFNELVIGDGNPDIPDDTYEGVVKYTRKPINNATLGYYADGFFDRRPIQSYSEGTGHPNSYSAVSPDTAWAAFRGTLFFNPTTYASVFFPSAGRRDAETGKLQYRGSTGYYSTSSLGNQWTSPSIPHAHRTVWSMQLDFTPAPVSVIPDFGMSIRCVVDE